MNKNLVSLLAALPLVMFGWAASAQEEEAEDLEVSPVETWTCNYRDGKGPADLDAAIANWNAWMDSEGIETYGAMTVTPWYHGEDSFDVGWLGFWTDGAAMGAGTDTYLGKGGEYAAGFADVVSCDTHSNFASGMIKSPGEGEPPDKLVLYFSDCKIREGANWDAVFAGLGAWADYTAEQDYGNGLWVLFPAFGGGDADYDFKFVASYDNHSVAGKAYDKYGNGGGWQKRQELLGDKLDCDVSRVYNATFRRKLPPPADD